MMMTDQEKALYKAKVKEWQQNNKDKTREYWKKWWEKNRGRSPAYHNYNRQRLGVTREKFEEMKSNQSNKCAICQRAKPLCVDHDHRTGKVRGLLCHSCNRAIGMLSDSIDRIGSAALYLLTH
jgi:hypothetical protein